MKIFIAGPRKVSILSNDIKIRLENILNSNFTVLLGDANGIDKAVQEYFHDRNYENIIIYATNGITRNNEGNWKVEKVAVKQNRKDFSFYTAKDRMMAKDCDYGFMIWNGESKGTLNNIINLLSLKKKVLVYFLPESKYYVIDSFEKAEWLIKKCNNNTKVLYDELLESKKCGEQITINY